MSTSKKRLVNQLGPFETPWIMEGSHFHVGINIQISLLIERSNHPQGVGHDMTRLRLGRYHKFMIFVGVRFSQSNLQKGSILPKCFFYARQGYQHLNK
jgi:hypothetical protein